jgi:hypothetical protein
VDDFENFQLASSADGALQFTVASCEGNRIAWMFSQKRLMIGTSGDEWTIGGADSSCALFLDQHPSPAPERLRQQDDPRHPAQRRPPLPATPRAQGARTDLQL